MRISPLNLEIVGHRPGEPSRPRVADGAAPWMAQVCARLADLFPVKWRMESGADRAARMRAQFMSRAARAQQRLSEGAPSTALPVHRPCSAKRAAQVASEALREVRHALYAPPFSAWKSDNKGDPAQGARRQAEGAATRPDRWASTQFRRNVNSPMGGAEQSGRVWGGLTSNCSDLARAALDYVAHHHPQVPTAFVVLGGQHSVAVIGALDEPMAQQPMSTWPRTLAVCDPWANIHCPAPEYAERFATRMIRWASQGQQVCDDHGQWHAATDASVRAGFDQPPLVFLREHAPHGAFTEQRLSGSARKAESLSTPPSPPSPRSPTG